MDQNARPEILKRVKEANARESRKLEKEIAGMAGIEAQFKLAKQHTEQECDTLRRELAQVYITGRRERVKNSRYWGARLSVDTDPTLLMTKERENARRRKNRKLLNRAKQKEFLMKEMVKEFVSKIDKDLISHKIRELDPRPKDLLALLEESHLVTTESSSDVADELANTEEIEEKAPSFYRSTSQDWREARKTRYVRTRVLRDFEKELTPKEIFSEK